MDPFSTEVHVHALVQLTYIRVWRQLQAEIRKTLVRGGLLVAGHTFHSALHLAIE